MPEIDILGLGAVAVDDLLFVEAYPPPDGKVRVRGRDRQCGGLTATALVAASRLGARCSYAGVMGDDELSRFVAANFKKEGIDLEYLACRPPARPVSAVIIVDQTTGTRNIFFDREGVIGAGDDWPPAEVIQSCKVLFVDSIGIPGMIRAARIARAAGIPVVADIESDDPLFEELQREIDHLIISWEFVQCYTGAATPNAAAKEFWSPQREVVVITCGAEGCWYLSHENPDQALHVPAFKVQPVDTTGCGDVFHGAYAAGLVKGLNLQERLRFASGAAAMKAMSRGGQTGAPTTRALEAFLKERS
jgi:sulfofructose kinase